MQNPVAKFERCVAGATDFGHHRGRVSAIGLGCQNNRRRALTETIVCLVGNVPAEQTYSDVSTTWEDIPCLGFGSSSEAKFYYFIITRQLLAGLTVPVEMILNACIRKSIQGYYWTDRSISLLIHSSSTGLV